MASPPKKRAIGSLADKSVVEQIIVSFILFPFLNLKIILFREIEIIRRTLLTMLKWSKLMI